MARVAKKGREPRLCNVCRTYARNSRFGARCTACGKAGKMRDADVQDPVASPLPRAKRASAERDSAAISRGGVVRLCPVPLEILSKLEEEYLCRDDFYRELSRNPRVLQQLGGDAARGEVARNLLVPWALDRLHELGAPKDMAVGNSDASVLLSSLCDTGIAGNSGGKLPPHQDYKPQEHPPGERSWNFVILMSEVDESEAPQMVWTGSRDARDPTQGRETSKWLDLTFPRLSLTGPVGTAYVFDSAVWHAVGRMRAPRTLSTRANPATGRVTSGGAVRVRTCVVVDCRTGGLPPPHFNEH